MKELIDELVARGIQLPILLRFSDILKARIELLCASFNSAIREYGYTGQYRGVYPIKVNQNRTVVEEIIEYGRPFHYGLDRKSTRLNSSHVEISYAVFCLKKKKNKKKKEKNK